MLSHKKYIDKKIASALIHTAVANFDQSSYPERIPHDKITFIRYGLQLLVIIALILQYISQEGDLIMSIFLDLELYTTISCTIALTLAQISTKVKNRFEPSGLEIRNKRRALIWNSLALTLNIAVVVIYFVFIPITLASDGKMTSSYYINCKTPAFLLSFTAIVGHFFLVNFVMLERDYRWIIIGLGFWGVANLTVEMNGLFFKELKGSKNVIKIAMVSFFILATTCMYMVLCKLSQHIKGIYEKTERKKILKIYGRASQEEDDEDEDDYGEDYGEEDDKRSLGVDNVDETPLQDSESTAKQPLL